MIDIRTARKPILRIILKWMLTYLLYLQISETECAVPIDIVTEKITVASMKKQTPAIIPMIPDKIPIITSTRRRVATTNPRRGIYNWWYGMWGYTFQTHIIHYIDVTHYEYFTFYDSYYFQDAELPFYEKARNLRVPKLLQGAKVPKGQVPQILKKMVSEPEFHDGRLAQAMGHLPPLKFPDYFHGFVGQKKEKVVLLCSAKIIEQLSMLE